MSASLKLFLHKNWNTNVQPYFQSTWLHLVVRRKITTSTDTAYVNLKRNPLYTKQNLKG